MNITLLVLLVPISMAHFTLAVRLAPARGRSSVAPSIGMQKYHILPSEVKFPKGESATNDTNAKIKDKQKSPYYKVTILTDKEGNKVTEQIINPQENETRVYVYNHPSIGNQFDPVLGNVIIEEQAFTSFEGGFKRQKIGPAQVTTNILNKNDEVIKKGKTKKRKVI